MAAGTSVSIVDAIPGLSKTLLYFEVTKAGATDTVEIPDGYGDTLAYINVMKKSSGVPDPVTAISGKTATLSVGTGVMSGIAIIE